MTVTAGSATRHQLRMKRKLLVLSFSAVIMAAPWMAQAQDSAADAATAEAPTPGRHHGHGEFWATLNLTDAQKQQVHQIMQSNKPALRAARLQELTAAKAVDEAVASDPNNEASIRAASVALARARTELTVQRARVYAQISKVLTPDQLQQLTQRKEKKAQWRQKQIDRLSQTHS
jgi:protein CpxP